MVVLYRLARSSYRRGGFTLIEMLVAIVIIGIAMRVILPSLVSRSAEISPEQEWVAALDAAEHEARKSNVWIEVSFDSDVVWKRWSWQSNLHEWAVSTWMPPATLSSAALKVRSHTPLPSGHLWLPPQRVIPFFQGVCLSEQSCVFRMPMGQFYVGAMSDIQNTAASH